MAELYKKKGLDPKKIVGDHSSALSLRCRDVFLGPSARF